MGDLLVAYLKIFIVLICSSLAGQVHVSCPQVLARKINALMESSVRNKPVGVCCFTITMQEAGFGKLKTAEETLACKVSKCTFASQLGHSVKYW